MKKNAKPVRLVVRDRFNAVVDVMDAYPRYWSKRRAKRYLTRLHDQRTDGPISIGDA